MQVSLEEFTHLVNWTVASELMTFKLQISVPNLFSHQMNWTCHPSPGDPPPWCHPPSSLGTSPTRLARPRGVLGAPEGLSTPSVRSLPVRSPVPTGWNPPVRAFLQLPLQPESLPVLPSSFAPSHQPSEKREKFKTDDILLSAIPLTWVL